jgi:hypothetical protein
MTPQKKQILFMIVGVFVVGYIAMHILARQGQPMGTTNINDETAYVSTQERRMPCGRILKRTVESRGGAWAKTVTLMDPDGRVLQTKTQSVEPESCAAIQAGRFVPNLWSDCQVQL